MKRFVGCAVLCLSLLVSVRPAVAEKAILTDVAGRAVEVEVPVRKMVLGEGRFLPILGILDKDDPVKWVAAMMGDFKRLDPTNYKTYREMYPALGDIPEVGVAGAPSFSSEQAIGAVPDVAIFGLGSGHGPSESHKEILDQLASAGIPVVVVDFRRDPLVNTPKSVELLGRLMGREKQAAAFLDFYRRNLQAVHGRLDGVARKPEVFMDMRVGLRDTCCEASGNEMLGRFIDWAGGHNIVADKIPGTHGVVNPEYLIATQPDIYVATAIGNYPVTDPASNRVVLGVGVPRGVAVDTLRHAVARPIVSELTAVKSGRAFAIWHHFYNTPMNVVAVQAMAKWFHPDRFADLDPNATLAEFFERFQAVPLNGVYWTGLNSE